LCDSVLIEELSSYQNKYGLFRDNMDVSKVEYARFSKGDNIVCFAVTVVQNIGQTTHISI